MSLRIDQFSPKQIPVSKEGVKTDERVEDIWSSICTFLSREDLARLGQVDQFRKNVIEIPSLWKDLAHLRKERLIEDFSSLVEKGILSWKEAHFYQRFSPFINGMIADLYASSVNLFLEENPQYAHQKHPEDQLHRAVARHEDITATIFNKYHVKLRKTGEEAFTLLEGVPENGFELIDLAFEGNFLFAVRKNEIVQWDYTKGLLVQTISFPRFRAVSDRIFVQEGYLVLKCGDFMAVIDYKNQNQRVHIELEKGYHLRANQVFIRNHQLYVLHTYHVSYCNIATAGREKIKFYERSRKQGQIYPQSVKMQDLPSFKCMAFEKNILCLCSTLSETGVSIYLFDLDTGRELKAQPLDPSVRRISRCMLFGHLLIGLGLYSEVDSGVDFAVMIVDMNTGKLVNRVLVSKMVQGAWGWLPKIPGNFNQQMQALEQRKPEILAEFMRKIKAIKLSSISII